MIVSTGVWDVKKEDQLALDLNKIDVYGRLDPERPLVDTDLHDGDLDLAEFPGKAFVQDGRAADLFFAVNDRFIDDARLFRGDQPYNGPLHISGTFLSDGEGRSLNLNIRGLAVQNSSALTSFAFQRGFEGASRSWAPF